MTPKPVLIDTDPGLDDALALILALRSRTLDVRAITVVAGNVGLSACTANALRILDVLGPRPAPPVFEGCAGPLSPRVARAEHVHGSDGLGGTSQAYPVGARHVRPGHAADAIAELARRYRNELTVIALGPLTNLATALKRDPQAMAGIRELVVMGGSVGGRGNATASAEFNFYSDPQAARAVVRSGLNVTMVGLDVTERARLPRARFERRLAAMPDGRLRSFLGDIAAPYFDFCRKERGLDSCALHDPLAVAVAINSGCVRLERFCCDVVTTQGLTRGSVLADPAGSNPSSVHAGVEVDTERFLDTFLSTVCDA